MTMGRIFLFAATLLAGLAVAFGAFGAHALRSQLDANALAIFETAVRYQMYHALALALVALWLDRPSPSPTLAIAGYSFIAGTVLFSGSLYALSLTGIKVLGAVTPLGGVAYLVGWICFALAAWSLKS
jgi:uncharacterized membrane protein YgdD (TMEM256/DUF423 family)